MSAESSSTLPSHIPAHVADLMYKESLSDIVHHLSVDPEPSGGLLQPIKYGSRTSKGLTCGDNTSAVTEFAACAAMLAWCTGMTGGGLNCVQLFLCSPELQLCAHINLHEFKSKAEGLSRPSGLERALFAFYRVNGDFIYKQDHLQRIVGSTQVVFGLSLYLAMMSNENAEDLILKAGQSLQDPSLVVPACVRAQYPDSAFKGIFPCVTPTEDASHHAPPSYRDQSILEVMHCWMTMTVAEYESSIGSAQFFLRSQDYGLCAKRRLIDRGSARLICNQEDWTHRLIKNDEFFEELIPTSMMQRFNINKHTPGVEWYIDVLRSKAVIDRAMRPMPPRPTTCSQCGKEGARKVCAGCRKAVYCSDACRVAHWNTGVLGVTPATCNPKWSSVVVAMGHRVECLGMPCWEA